MKRRGEKLIVFLALGVFVAIGAWKWFSAHVQKPALVLAEEGNQTLAGDGKGEEDLLTKSSVGQSDNKDLSNEELGEKNSSADEGLTVYVDGQVNKPGLICLPSGSRISDALEAAGGLNDKADISMINPARKVEDEMKITVPSVEEVKEAKSAPDRQIQTEPVQMPSSSKNLTGSSAEGIIDINKASLDELQELPSIGEKKARAIIDYRQERPFEKIEDIMEVSGIGEKVFEKLKDYISVGK